MRKGVGILLLLVVVALWIANGYRTQAQVGPQNVTVQAQLTSVSRPVPTPTP